MAGRAMIQGAINGIAQFDSHAHFASLEQPQHHSDWIGWYLEPDRNEEAFQWADCILDIAGLHTNQPNKYIWMALRQKYKKPYVFMSQSFKSIDPVLFNGGGVKIVARGARSARRVMDAGFPCVTAPDLSFLVEPTACFEYEDSWRFKEERFKILRFKRIFNTHIGKFWETMQETADPKTDIQVIEKRPQDGTVWEPALLGITGFSGTPEQNFGMVAQAEEVHVSRYQLAVAAILAGKKPIIYRTHNPEYDEKYDDLMDYYGKTVDELRAEALQSCRVAWEVVSG
jgi:hypothetical protein